MALAIAGLLSNLHGSLSNAARLTDYDRAAVLARRQMDELLLNKQLPKGVLLEAPFDPAMSGAAGYHWRARVLPFESVQPQIAPGQRILERIELEVSWSDGKKRKTLTLEAFRQNIVRPEDMLAIAGGRPAL